MTASQTLGVAMKASRDTHNEYHGDQVYHSRHGPGVDTPRRVEMAAQKMHTAIEHLKIMLSAPGGKAIGKTYDRLR